MDARGASQRLRHLDGIQYFVDDFFGGDILSLGLVSQTDTVTQNIRGHGTDVLGDDIATVLDEGLGLGSQGQVDGGTRRAAVADHVGELLQLVVRGIT